MNKHIIGKILLINLMVIDILTGCFSRKGKTTPTTSLLVTEVQASGTPASNIRRVIPLLSPTSSSVRPTQPTETIKPTETLTPISTLTSTPTSSPSPTETPTSTLIPTATETPSPTASPTPNMVMPGFYATGDCATVEIAYSVEYTFCVTSVTITRERHMLFSVSWTLTDISARFKVSKGSDKGNRRMYLIDNLGNRYDHIAGGGAAYQRVGLENNIPITGWFEFGAPPPGASKFTFYDDDNKLVIKNIALVLVIVIYEDWNLINYPLSMEYRKENWSLIKAEDGSYTLNHAKIPTCTMQERVTAKPQGKFKNSIQLGKVTFDIYGYIEQGKNLGIREYLAISGLTNLEPGVQPFFYVTIPLDDSLQCIQDVSEVLATLSEKTP
jgi:hypothetical protein